MRSTPKERRENLHCAFTSGSGTATFRARFDGGIDGSEKLD
jgi:hypothetical protein